MKFKRTNYTLLSRGETDSSKPQQKWHRSRKNILAWVIPSALITIIVVLLAITNSTKGKIDPNDQWPTDGSKQPACPQYPAVKSNDEKVEGFRKEIMEQISSKDFLKESTKRLQGAVQIPTESFDDMGPVGEEPRFDIFKDLHEYFEKTFPRVWEKLEITKINTYGIFIEWKGEDEDLKPYLFMGHQDVVPVLGDTKDLWTYPPYSAHYDDRYIWGRGASDCKNVVIGVLEALEVLLERDYKPKRTILVGFGFDEEISGFQGAAYIAQHIKDTRGGDSIELIIDEGGLGIREMSGALFALPGVGEKGYFDATITVETKGGHSSIPPDHTGIGILSQIIKAVEDNPYEPELTPVNPFFTTLQCTAQYSPDLDDWLRKTLQEAQTSKKAAKTAADYIATHDISQRYLMQTSQATDLISGGVKINALPEKVFAVVNHRIAMESTVLDVKHNLKSVITSEILNKFDLSLNAWGDISGNTSTTSAGRIVLSDFDIPLDPSPVSPYDTDTYKTFTGTIKQIMGHDIVVAPSIMTGNTDTKFFWDLSKNIYRFSPTRQGGSFNAHTVDERIGMKEHVEGVGFYVQLILNGDL